MTDVKHTLKLWWIPQIPMKAFEVEIASLEEGVKLLEVLANYDLFQFENNVKPDYSNAGGIVMFEAESGEWVDWYDDDTGEDDPREYLATNPTS
jgi:hypothetical protein